jgi:hypothetical protein
VNCRSVAAVAHHLESGTCAARPHFNDDTLYAFIRNKDPDEIVTSAASGNQGQGFSGKDAGEQMRRGRWYPCPLCWKRYRVLEDLRRHLDSGFRKSNPFSPAYRPFV